MSLGIRSNHTVTMGIYRAKSWYSGWESFESRVVEGTVRVIDDQLWYAWQVGKPNFWTGKSKVLWARVTEKQLQGENKLPSQRATQ